MARILITGSADGLGLMAGQLLAGQGHEIVLHARSEFRAAAARKALRTAAKVLIGDVSTIAAMREVADQANAFGRFDAVIHNVGLGYRERERVATEDGLSQLFAVNTLAPYLLTALIDRPDRLVYLSSGMHRSGDPRLDDLQWGMRPWDGSQAYADTKLHDAMIAFAVARRWPDICSNAVEPGWVPTRMGGANAPDDLEEGAITQAWLAAGEDPETQVTGEYFYHQKPAHVNPASRREDLQDRLMDYCAELTGVEIG
ncbi:SDR family NAD(P)-dependent oxidoreductase [Sphingosinicella rhizophila]|uniref:SDR family NAD(P)-dependent oxidoreductase n=1 Tax=Sphingosinicella rhizophila TaxID=3050082 RepID=A0ABU3QB84_9SPHN|nr:SDR family NAD(P)-dependent oxidoreductase [Sphingosinicella sp. GR2756]MDT9600656.1 SDR family NAD(P)-dependent oxidoreductase [Sphingosinicella sp. GR2756]